MANPVFSPALLMGLVLAGAAAFADPGPDFIRGDVNNDGVVTISDAYRMIIAWQGAHPGFPGFTCEAAADANDDGQFRPYLSLLPDVDHLYVYYQVSQGSGFFPCPYPAPGQDYTPNSYDFFTCESYGGEGPLEDPLASLEVRPQFIPANVSERDGLVHDPPRVEIDVVMRITNPIAAYSFKLRMPSFLYDWNEYRDSLPDIQISEVHDGERVFLVTGLLVKDIYDALARGPVQRKVFPGLQSWSYSVFLESGSYVQLRLDLTPQTRAGDFPIRIEAAELTASSRPRTAFDPRDRGSRSSRRSEGATSRSTCGRASSFGASRSGPARSSRFRSS